MISEARLYWMLHGLFANAQTLGEVRFINQKFAAEIDVLELKTRFHLSGVYERRVSELEGIEREQDRDQVGHGQSHAPEQQDTQRGVSTLRIDLARDTRSATQMPAGSLSGLRTEGN